MHGASDEDNGAESEPAREVCHPILQRGGCERDPRHCAEATSEEALQLLKRGEAFLRPRLPDSTARKSLVSVLFMQLKLQPHCGAARQLVSLIDHSDPNLRAAFWKQLQDMSAEGEMQGLFLKMLLEEGEEIPQDLLVTIRIEEDLLDLSPEHMLRLAEALGKNRRADGACVAVYAANAFDSVGKATERDDAFLLAFTLDPSNTDAAQTAAQVVLHTRERCKVLERREKLDNGQGKCFISWDLSTYDFTSFTKGQVQKSETFQVLSGINAWLEMYPKGDSTSLEGMVACLLRLDRPARVKFTMESQNNSETHEHDFESEAFGNSSFMPISEVKSRITLRILSVQGKGSKLRMLDGDYCAQDCGDLRRKCWISIFGCFHGCQASSEMPSSIVCWGFMRRASTLGLQGGSYCLLRLLRFLELVGTYFTVIL